MNVFFASTGVSDGTMKISVEEKIEKQNDVDFYYSNLGKVKFYDGTEGELDTTGIDGKLEVIHVNGETYYTLPKPSNGTVYTFGDANSQGVPTNTARAATVKVNLYNADGKLLDIISTATTGTFDNPNVNNPIETEADTYADIDLTQTSYAGGTWLNPNEQVLSLPHSAFLKKGNAVYPVNIRKTDVQHVESITLNKTQAELQVGDTLTLTAKVNPENAVLKDVVWSTSDNGVATVSSNGTVTAVKAGTVTITAKTANGTTAQCTIVVSKPKPIDPSKPSPESTWDDGGPFTKDVCGNVFDRWGNKIYSAPACEVSGGYQVPNTGVR